MCAQSAQSQIGGMVINDVIIRQMLSARVRIRRCAVSPPGFGLALGPLFTLVVCNPVQFFRVSVCQTKKKTNAYNNIER